MKDWTEFAQALQELLGWFSHAEIAGCPECGDSRILNAQLGECEVQMIVNSHGLSVPIRCGAGHTWTLRISSWRSDYPDVRKNLAAKMRVWQVEDLQAEIRSKEKEVEELRQKYFDLREELMSA